MIYIYWYLGIGAIVLSVVYGVHHLTRKKDPDSLRDLLEAVNPNRKKLSYRILNKIVAPFLAAIFVLAVWPVPIYMKLKEMRQKKESYVPTEDREFAVEREHLLERLTVQEIERREVVTDPLNAAPQLAFGHLHAAWREFLQAIADGSELWSFSAHWQTTWGRKELRCGYAAVQDGVPGAHFLTVLKDVPAELKANSNTKQVHAD